MVRSIFLKALSYNVDSRMALVAFQSHQNDWIVQAYPFTGSSSTLEERINALETKAENFDECKAIGDAIRASVSLDWRPANDTNQFREKLMILFTDGPPCNLSDHKCSGNSCDLWRMSDRLVKENITLIVIGIEPCVVVCDDFYYALARKTGGEYIPLINAHRVLSSVVEQATLSEYTIPQLLRRLDTRNEIELNSFYNYASVEKRAWFMIEHCQTMAEIRKKLYTYRRPAMISCFGENSFEAHSPEMPGNYIDFWRENVSGLTSTPIADDEGYRTRLPTTASVESSFIYLDDSPNCSPHTDSSLYSEIDDESC